MSLIRSGSHTPGVEPESFGLPVGTAIRYERPADELADFLPSYVVLDADMTVWTGPQSWMLPSWAQIWIVLTLGTITVKVRSRKYCPLASAVLYGVTSRAMPVTSQGGVTVAIDINPLGWARFLKPSAESLRDRITPLHELLPPDQIRDLANTLQASDRDLAVKRIIDESFIAHLPPPNPDEPMVAAIMAILASENAVDLAASAQELGIGQSTLTRLSKRYFGFTPKMLIMRTRFLRALTTMLTSDEPVDFAHVPPGYHNVPHFIRDANLFLGMTPRRFIALDMPYLRAALRARKAVIGVGTPSLDPVRERESADPDVGRGLLAPA